MSDDYFVPENIVGKAKTFQSPSGLFTLTVTRYKTRDGCWDYSRGEVRTVSGVLVADVQRNYSTFWHAWGQHPNGNEYLLCGADYQGQTVVNCTTGQRYDYLPPEAENGYGFCWANCTVSGTTLVVDGCYWACPYERVVYDWTNPDILPYPETNRTYLADEDESEEGGNDAR